MTKAEHKRRQRQRIACTKARKAVGRAQHVAVFGRWRGSLRRKPQASGLRRLPAFQQRGPSLADMPDELLGRLFGPRMIP